MPTLVVTSNYSVVAAPVNNSWPKRCVGVGCSRGGFAVGVRQTRFFSCCCYTIHSKICRFFTYLPKNPKPQRDGISVYEWKPLELHTFFQIQAAWRKASPFFTWQDRKLGFVFKRWPFPDSSLKLIQTLNNLTRVEWNKAERMLTTDWQVLGFWSTNASRCSHCLHRRCLKHQRDCTLLPYLSSRQVCRPFRVRDHQNSRKKMVPSIALAWDSCVFFCGQRSQSFFPWGFFVWRLLEVHRFSWGMCFFVFVFPKDLLPIQKQ